ncbi:glycosyltransferase [Microvirga sp. BT689]|uniref:glycosyltransferase family 2 protein n=1 Tax=Microvirga arvi TaxID=2778731 RepID=UPI001951160F|nr:glycosyltransferase [Microvirga arvi]MBM6582052.1 glycosyltransferase [Microvirga arvi]
MKVSIIIKALNEETNIARSIESSLAALKGLDGEVILADSVSTDRTVEIASAYPITIVQLQHTTSRGCGSAPQLGYQYSSGDFIYLLDGDMVLYQDFLTAALATLESDHRLAGVGGVIRDMNLDNLEFAARAARNNNTPQAGDTDRLNGGGLYRRAAIESVGYLSDMNLHAFEEFELGARLRALGWRLTRLDKVAVDHFGYTIGAYKLLWNRVKSGYAYGAGEIARAAVGKPYLFDVLLHVRTLWVSLCVIAWLLTVLLIIPFSFDAPLQGLVTACSLLLFPILVMSLKRRSLRLGTYAVAVWLVLAICTIKGFFRPRLSPDGWIPSRVVRSAHELESDLYSFQSLPN